MIKNERDVNNLQGCFLRFGRITVLLSHSPFPISILIFFQLSMPTFMSIIISLVNILGYCTHVTSQNIMCCQDVDDIALKQIVNAEKKR